MKIKSLKALLLGVITIIIALTFSACAVQTFDASGEATITITLDKAYENIYVSCPGAEITGGGTSYSVKLSTRAETDVIVSCEGYFTEYLNFKTSDLKSGSASKSLTLRERVTSVTVSVRGISDTTGVTISSVGGLFTADAVRNADGTFSLSYDRMTSDTIEIKKTGYATNTISFSASDFNDYSLSITAPLVVEGDTGDAAITFINLNSINNGTAIFYRYGYQDRIVEASASLYGSGDKVVYLDRTKNYVFSANETVLITSMSLKDNPYRVFNAGELFGSSVQIRVTAPGLSDFASEIVNSHTATAYVSVNETVANVTNNNAVFSYVSANFARKAIKDINTVRVLVSRYDNSNGWKIYALYEKTNVTRAQLLAGIEIENLVDDTLTSIVYFVDEDGAPFTGYEMSYSGTSVTYADGASSAEINIKQFVIEENGNIEFSTADNTYTSQILSINSILANATFIARLYYNVRVKLVDINGDKFDVDGVDSVNDGYYNAGPRAIGDDINFNLGRDYISVNGLIFSKEIFTYNTESGYWEYVLTVYESKDIKITLPSYITFAYSYNIYSNTENIYFYSGSNTITVTSLDIGKTVNLSINVNNFNDSSFYRASFQITPAIFNAGTLDLTNYITLMGK